ncbi:MAG: hypothetical protein HN348_15320, partial [Proteobacteria bacterium]|nr:hypothetical protein [Pseudomonadota bacterium]
MSIFPGMSATGRRVRGPITDLIEFIDDDDVIFTALVFQSAYRSDPTLDDGIETILGFLEMSMVPGLLDLKLHPAKTGTFVYRTLKARSLWELVGCFDEPMGEKAGLEVLEKGAAILLEAAATGEVQGVYCHGGIAPTNVLVSEEGAVGIIGYGIPQVDILDFLDDEEFVPKADRLRCCPPERLQGEEEDISTDLFCLALVAAE